MSYEITLDNFQGPLDLLLHLIRHNEMDIYDIHMAQITHQYLDILEQMKQLNLDVAGEFLWMAATLIHIKSKMLLPPTEGEEEEGEEGDPRAELVRRLLDYQRYKEAAEWLDDLPHLGCDVFKHIDEPMPQDKERNASFEAVGLYELAHCFQALLKDLPAETYHEIIAERFSVTGQIHRILEQLEGKSSLAFSETFSPEAQRHEMVVNFLAMLELVKLRVVKLVQVSGHGPIWIQPAVEMGSSEKMRLQEEQLGYA